MKEWKDFSVSQVRGVTQNSQTIDPEFALQKAKANVVGLERHDIESLVLQFAIIFGYNYTFHSQAVDTLSYEVAC